MNREKFMAAREAVLAVFDTLMEENPPRLKFPQDAKKQLQYERKVEKNRGLVRIYISNRSYYFWRLDSSGRTHNWERAHIPADQMEASVSLLFHK